MQGSSIFAYFDAMFLRGALDSRLDLLDLVAIVLRRIVFVMNIRPSGSDAVCT